MLRNIYVLKWYIFKFLNLSLESIITPDFLIIFGFSNAIYSPDSLSELFLFYYFSVSFLSKRCGDLHWRLCDIRSHDSTKKSTVLYMESSAIFSGLDIPRFFYCFWFAQVYQVWSDLLQHHATQFLL